MKFPIFLLFLIISAGIASAKGDCNADGKITSVDALIALKMFTNPSMNIYSNEETVRRILNSKNPDEIKEGIKNGEIRIEGVGIVNQIRVTVMNLFSKFL